jgi:hypothetical protein
MTEFPYGNTIFCDDIRFEIGGKASLMGCFGAELRAFGQAPLMLSSLAAFVSVRIPQAMVFQKLAVVLLADFGDSQKEVARVDLPVEPKQRDGIEAGQLLSVDVPFRLSPFIIEGEGFLRCRAYLDELEVKLGSLRVAILGVDEIPPELKVAIPAAS